MWRSVIYFVLYLTTVLEGTSACPHRCLCFRTTVRCMFLQLEQIPQVPSDTMILDLRFNKIKSIPRGSFGNLSSLKTLLLNNNELESLDDGAFQGLGELRYLYLYKNKIETIHTRVFRDLPKLEQLFLHSNKLKSLPKGVFSHSRHLRRLRLDSNALVCDCQLMWLSDMLKEKHGYTQAAATCQFPSKLQGRSLMSISQDDFHCEYQVANDSDHRSEMPRFTMEPRDVDVTFGNTAYFTCRAEGTPNPEIIWLHNSEMVEPDNRLTILSDGTLMIQETKDTDKGAYECVARNAAGEVKTNKVELRYFGEPVIPTFMETPADITDVAGETIQLLCRAQGNPRPDITWTKNGSPLQSSSRFRLLSNGALMIRDLREEDEGLYRCSAANSIQTITASARVTIQSPPEFFVIPRDQEVQEGNNADFSCNARGDPSPVLSWVKDGRPIPTNRRYTLQNGGRLFRILNTESSDSGQYTCRAENAAGEQQASARLHIISHTAPVFSERTVSSVPTAGSDISMECHAEGNPIPHYQWRKEGRRISNSQKYVLQGNTLTVRNVQHGDSGRYDCIAQNLAGRSVKSVNVQVQGIPTPTRRGDNFVHTASNRARSIVNNAINDTLRDLFNGDKTHTIEDLLRIFRYPAPEALELARAEEIFEQTLNIIHQHVNDGNTYELDDHEENYRELVSPSHLSLIANMSGCRNQYQNIDCSNTCFHRKYRTLDGTCNNFNQPDWGASNKAFLRLLEPIYENGFNTPVGWVRSRRYNGQQLPSPRLISSLMMSTSHVTEDEDYTHMLMQWGQFMDHDMSLAPQSVSFARFSDGRRCNESCENISPCFPIPVPNSDGRVHTRCLGFSRSSATCNTGSTSIFYHTVSPRQQINSLTTFIDASNVYGSTPREAESLRDLSNNRGLLRVGSLTLRGSRYLPFDDDSLSHVDCQIEPSKRHVPCFRAGDHRANEHLALTAMHTLWLREHNRIATIILQLNPHWDGNKVYHETRKLIGGVMQHITYTQWIPKILGTRGMELMGPYKGYDPSVNPTISNVFATAALRFGHSLVQPVIFRLNETFQPIPEGNLPLHKAFFSPYKIMEEGGIDPLLRGMFGVAAKKRMPGELLNTELTEKLFSLANSIGQDLASLNIQRGRDHGLPFYNAFRNFCNMSPARTFNDLRHEIRDRDTRAKLQDLYGHPDNIDVFVGGMAETPLDGAKVGPTFLCILADQFKRQRAGDRFWYEKPGVFNTEQIVQIRQMSLARVICDNTDSINKVQLDVFKRNTGDYKTCDDIPSLDLRMWTDCCEDCRRTNNFQSFARHFRGRRSVEYSYPDHQDAEEMGPPANVTEPVVAAEEEPGCNSTDATPSIVQDDVMLLDSRLEWMEATMAEMVKNYSKLKRKMRNMQKVLQGRNYHCKDHKRKKRVHGEKWKIDTCKICQCKKGQVECDRQVCPPVTTCSNPRKEVGKCCATCD
ncbi:peroxidasin-like isoform X1 [Haliotis rufescens]|uniref:peroxidasin-like isoform X1 n=1 Tax=Haliotis rufescens TaxID=6454 RepID=UPI00201F1447|nr:peroxidasin-like isoform X1 [Haliotis rufescens]